MQMEKLEQGLQEKKEGKKLYAYQQKAIESLFARIDGGKDDLNLLYQLPTGGGKTVIFSEISKRFIKSTNKKVLILTHRVELAVQTSVMLEEFGVKNKVINAKVKELPDQDEYMCFVAMVETLNNRLKDEDFDIANIGMVIVDEAHYNSFRKLFKHFESVIILGVTATPLSSNVKLPMKDNYDELLVGESISTLVGNGFLSKAKLYSYDVKLGSLTVGANGDYSVRSSERLYTNSLMQNKLLFAYEEVSKGKKTLIFNNGIQTSLEVQLFFSNAGYDVRHLDNTHGAKDRREILDWFKHTPKAILTSVGILTTGFDEPTVETIILNRATKSLTLYYQMIGRGSRILPNKNKFQVIDLGNNSRRFGAWDAPVDWHYIFRSPQVYYDNLLDDSAIERQFVYYMPEELMERFSKTKDINFDIKEAYKTAINKGQRSKTALEQSINQHLAMCVENAEDLYEAIELSVILKDDIEYRVKTYSYCICKSTANYLQWLEEDYYRKLRELISISY
jgi:superfamily II DNA or RNA helicase